MPIYEFRCKKGHNFEVLQRMTDDPVTSCQVCGAPVERVFHPIAVHFKGSGFYNTDYGTRKRSREMKEAKEGSKTESTSDSSSSSKSSDANGNGSKSDSGSSKSDSGSSKSDSGNSKSGSGSGKSERSKAPARD
jgi:putative FmdB family regulatory protein